MLCMAEMNRGEEEVIEAAVDLYTVWYTAFRMSEGQISTRNSPLEVILSIDLIDMLCSAPRIGMKDALN